MVGWLVKKTLPCSLGLAEKLFGTDSWTENSGTDFDQPLWGEFRERKLAQSLFGL
jgi:hypothetical protein